MVTMSYNIQQQDATHGATTHTMDNTSSHSGTIGRTSPHPCNDSHVTAHKRLSTLL